jgi:hypothetical protein
MGILDDAIREHLELKRQHGAGDPELKQLEDEAFGPPERPGGGETPPDPFAEAPTEFMTAPEGEVQARHESPGIADLQEAPPPAEPAEEEQPAMEHEVVPEPPQPAGGHSTEERHVIAEQPTEMFDVEEEIEVSAAAEGELEEDEDDDFFDEQRLSDELDQALEAPAEVPEEPEAGVEVEEEEVEEPDAEVEIEESDEADEEEVVEDLAVEDEDEGEPGAEPAPSSGDREDDVLEDTPDFLEDSEDDELWFEQKPPKDFDFDD